MNYVVAGGALKEENFRIKESKDGFEYSLRKKSESCKITEDVSVKMLNVTGLN
jgi:hypothetical protein